MATKPKPKFKKVTRSGAPRTSLRKVTPSSAPRAYHAPKNIVTKKKEPPALQVIAEAGIQLDELATKVVRLMERQKTTSEEKIAEHLKMKINDARKILYLLASKGIATYEKKKDTKKKWWYVYFWSLDRDRLRNLVREHKIRELNEKTKQLEIETQHTFTCKACQRKYPYEEALESDFSCPACGSVLEQAKDVKLIRKLDFEIKKLERELGTAQ